MEKIVTLMLLASKMETFPYVCTSERMIWYILSKKRTSRRTKICLSRNLCWYGYLNDKKRPRRLVVNFVSLRSGDYFSKAVNLRRLMITNMMQTSETADKTSEVATMSPPQPPLLGVTLMTSGGLLTSLDSMRNEPFSECVQYAGIEHRFRLYL